MASYASIDRSIAKLGEMIEQRRGAPRRFKRALTCRIEARRSWINQKVARKASCDVAAEAYRQVMRERASVIIAGMQRYIRTLTTANG